MNMNVRRMTTLRRWRAAGCVALLAAALGAAGGAQAPSTPETQIPNLEGIWDGTPLSGRTILLASEQGFGDTIQFVRYALIAGQGGRVLLQCKSELKRLLNGQCGIEQVYSSGDAVPAFNKRK